MKTAKKLTTLAFIVLLACIVHAQDISLDVRPSTMKMGTENRLTLDVAIQGSDIGGVPAPRLPSSINADWSMEGRNSSSSTNISLVNGKMESSKTVTYHFYLRPKRAGKLAIPPISLKHKGKTYKSREFQIEVISGSMSSASTQRSRSNSRYSQQSSNQNQQQANIDDMLFLSASVSKKKVYMGEPIIINYTLYNRTNLLQLGLSKDATYPGFWAEDLFNADKINWKRTTIRGQSFNSMLIRRSALYPASTGKKTTTPMEIGCLVQSRSRDFFDFFGSRQQVTVKSDPINIEVMPLPNAGKPADFSGAVGDFTIAMTTDKAACQSNDAIQIFIKVTGNGNLKAIDDIKPKLPAAFEIYESNTTEKIINTSNGRKEKTYQYVIIPREKGNFTIPAVSLSFFDPLKEQYRRISTKSLEFAISEGSGEYTGSTIITKDDVITVGKDIAFIKTALPENNTELGLDILKKPHAFFFAYLLPIELAIIALAIIIRKRRQKLMNDSGYARFVGAASTAVSRIRKADQKDKNFIGEIAEALEHYIADKLDIVFGELPPEEILKILQDKGVEQLIIGKLKRLRAELDVARFAPGASELDPSEAKSQAIEIIKNLEKTLKTRGRAK